MQNQSNILKSIVIGLFSAAMGYLFVENTRLVVLIAGMWAIYVILTRGKNLLPPAPRLDDETLTVDEDGYADVAMSIEEVMAHGTTLAIILMILPLIPYFLIYTSEHFVDTTFTTLNLALAVPAILVAIIAHEFVHAITWVIFGGFSWRFMSFGIDRKTLSPYAHADVPMKAFAYRIGAAMPGLLTGIVPAIIALFIGHGALMLLSSFMISAAVGDVYVLWIIKNVPAETLVRDHPTKAGCLVKIEQ
ncbi:MAG: DUF3267 domain-containing protein [Aggregatilineales bacterium]